MNIKILIHEEKTYNVEKNGNTTTKGISKFSNSNNCLKQVYSSSFFREPASH